MTIRCSSHIRAAAIAFAMIVLQPIDVALARQDEAPVKSAIEDFLRIQTQGLPGEATFTVGAITANNLMPCASFAVSLPPGARAWGRTTVMVHCQAEGSWSLYVPVQVRIFGDYLVTARPLSAGQTVAEADLVQHRGDLAELPSGILTEPAQAVGKTVALSVASGRPLRSDMLRLALVVQQGQSIKVVAKGAGFQVAGGEGRALNNAADGQVVQIRLANGHVVSGIARAGGIAEISY